MVPTHTYTWHTEGQKCVLSEFNEKDIQMPITGTYWFVLAFENVWFEEHKREIISVAQAFFVLLLIQTQSWPYSIWGNGLLIITVPFQWGLWTQILSNRLSRGYIINALGKRALQLSIPHLKKRLSEEGWESTLEHLLYAMQWRGSQTCTLSALILTTICCSVVPFYW